MEGKKENMEGNIKPELFIRLVHIVREHHVCWQIYTALNMQVCPKCSQLLRRGLKRGLLFRSNRPLLVGQRKLSKSAAPKEMEKEARNPLLTANQYVKQPIFEDKDLIFRPTEAEVQNAGKLFENGRKHKIQMMKAAYTTDQAPNYTLPEIAMIGRSNVGKSSLIKALFSKVEDLSVRTSKSPGHTKLQLFYQAGSAFSLVDLPGYGFNQPENFAVTAEGYLRTRKNLQMTFLLIDSHVGFQPMDYTAIEMLEDLSRPYTLILTKTDKNSARRQVTSLMSIRDVLQNKTSSCLPQPFLVSATKKTGIPFLQSFIAYLTGKVRVQNR